MSSKIASKKRLEKHCDWAFDMTTRFQASSDEDSESDSGPKLATTNTGTGGLLIDDLDLSKRGENVAYKPNPFSIAKINAAYRRQTSTVQSPIQPVTPSDQNSATINIGAGARGLLIDDLNLSKAEENAAYNPNPFSIAKTKAAQRRQITTVEPIRPVRPSDQKTATTNIGAARLLVDDLSELEDNGAYNPNSYSIAKINAAYRPHTSTVNGSVLQATQPARLANKPTQTQRLTKRSRTDSKNQTTIMEGFKTQAMKKPRINNALQLRVPPLLSTSDQISPKSNLAVNKSSAGLSPSASPYISSPSPNPSSYLEKIRVPDDSPSDFMQVKSYAKHDAYQYSTKDVDEEWTTLPSKKKRRKPKTRNPTFTTSFHIPGLRLPSTTKAETIATSAAPKVKVYLPPPLNFVDVKRPTSKKNFGYRNGNEPSMEETENRKHVSPSSATNFYTNAYPSPSPSSSKVALSFIPQAKRARNHTVTPPRSRRGVQVETYRPPSPRTSDLPIPSDADIYVNVDHEGIQLRYAEMKRLSRKRRRATADVWNLMGVDSCGYVWKDVEGGGQFEDGQQTEIQIVMWSGLPTA